VVKNPLIKEKGDIQLGGSVGSTFDATLAYSPINHFYINAAAGSAPAVTETTSDTLLPPFEEKYTNHHYELSIGLYDTLFNYLRIQGAFGFGAGNAGGYRNNLDSGLTLLFPFAYATYGIYGSDYKNYFGQLSLIQNIGENLNLGLTYRFNFLEIDQLRFFDGDGRDADFDLSPRSHIVNQFAIELNKEEKHIGGFIQLQMAFASPYSEVITIRKTGFHVGIYLKLDELFGKSQSAKNRVEKPARIDTDPAYRSTWE
jgi:hypothetical protein